MIFLETILNTQSTYFVIDLTLFKLFNEILKEGKKGVIPILETRILLHILINIPFLNENKGTQILKDLTNSIENQWYSIKDTWNYNCILRELKILQKLVLYDYLICGSFIIYSDNHIKWELQTSILSTINKNCKKNRFTKIRKLLYKAQK